MSSSYRTAPTAPATILACVLLAFSPALAGSLTIEWDTNTEPDMAGYRVYMSTDSSTFGLTPDQAKAVATTQDVAFGLTSATFNGLDPSQTYWFGVTAFDTSDNESGFSNVVSAQPPDLTAPIVSVTAPVSGATLSDTVTLTATASDNVGVVGVQFKINGNDIGVEDTTAPWSISWDTSGVSNGTYIITAVARDAAGNTSASSLVTVSVDNTDVTAPSISITSPAQGATLSDTVTLTASASDDVGVVGVQFKLDGNDLGAEDTGNPWSTTWDTTQVADGNYTLTAVARDAGGNTTTAGSVSITVNNGDQTPPTISITSPSAGATVSGTVTITANASDNVGVVGVQFLVNGNFHGSEDTSNPWSVTWDTTQLANGTYTLTAVARDAAGNTTTAALVTLTVNNADTTPPAPPGNVRVRP